MNHDKQGKHKERVCKHVRKSIATKGAIQQVFIYIMAIVVIGFLVFVGAKMIYNVMDRQCGVQEANFVSNLQREISTATNYGAIKNSALTAPCTYELLCFVNANNVTQGHTISQPTIIGHETNLQIIISNTEAKIEYNVYLSEPGAVGALKPVLFDERLTTKKQGNEPDIVCVNRTRGAFQVRYEGLGRAGILVSTP